MPGVEPEGERGTPVRLPINGDSYTATAAEMTLEQLCRASGGDGEMLNGSSYYYNNPLHTGPFEGDGKQENVASDHFFLCCFFFCRCGLFYIVLFPHASHHYDSSL